MKKFVKTYYVVHIGKIPGIYQNWEECKKQIDKFEGAIFKKFTDKKDAEEFLKNGFGNGKKPKIITRRENEDKKNTEKILDETLDASNTLFIYTDGSCIRGGMNSLTRAGYGIYIPDKNIEVSAPLLNQKLTNNRAEITAIIESFKYLDETDLDKKICILTDSQYSMYIFHGTGERYEKNNYRNNEGKEVPNIDLIKKLLELKRKYNINLLKIRAHTNKKDEYSKGNELADKLATQGAFTELSTNEKNVFNNLCNKKKKSKSIYDSEDISETEDEYENNVVDNEYVNESEESDNELIPTSKSEKMFFSTNKKHNEDINKNVKINEMFDFDEIDKTSVTTLTSILKPSSKSKSLKPTKLSNWFVKNK